MHFLANHLADSLLDQMTSYRRNNMIFRKSLMNFFSDILIIKLSYQILAGHY